LFLLSFFTLLILSGSIDSRLFTAKILLLLVFISFTGDNLGTSFDNSLINTLDKENRLIKKI